MAEEEDTVGEIRTRPAGAPKMSRLSKNKSVMEITNNPFALAAAGSSALHVENLQDATLISNEEFQDKIVDIMKGTSDNDERVELLEDRRYPYLFTSAQLLLLCALQTSQKTQMRYIEIVGPRLIDPHAKTTELTGLFRFTEEKTKVEEVLRNRNNSITKTKNNVPGGGKMNPLGGRGGAGAGRGGAGRGAAAGQTKRPSSLPLGLKGFRSVFNLGRSKSNTDVKEGEPAVGPDMGPLPTESTDDVPHSLEEDDFNESPHVNQTKKPFA